MLLSRGSLRTFFVHASNFSTPTFFLFLFSLPTSLVSLTLFFFILESLFFLALPPGFFGLSFVFIVLALASTVITEKGEWGRRTTEGG